MTRKEQKEERRKAILFQALVLFVKKGYFETKITDIADAVSMSTGLLFHYFESKEDLLLELVKLGAESANRSAAMTDVEPEDYFRQLLGFLFSNAKTSPGIYYMFVLMGQVRREGMPEDARKVASSVNQIETCAKLIEKGQKKGIFREGDPFLLSTCFWAAVQGVMEEMTFDESLQMPDPEWLISILLRRDSLMANL